MVGVGGEEILVRLGGADVHAAIHLSRVHADQFAIELIANSRRRVCFPRCGGAHQENDGRQLNVHA